ncbi:hypothetical protein Slala02_11080 [Streptomyces lavendulae subsp. lavendulae]|nr:hypothetical protein Slala02_11080 [Streptomyces lavendulae subsp. lavendulae]
MTPHDWSNDGNPGKGRLMDRTAAIDFPARGRAHSACSGVRAPLCAGVVQGRVARSSSTSTEW